MCPCFIVLVEMAIEASISSLSASHIVSKRRFRHNFERAAALREQSELFNAYVPLLARLCGAVVLVPCALVFGIAAAAAACPPAATVTTTRHRCCCCCAPHLSHSPSLVVHVTPRA
jgi:hypothetical protein